MGSAAAARQATNPFDEPGHSRPPAGSGCSAAAAAAAAGIIPVPFNPYDVGTARMIMAAGQQATGARVASTQAVMQARSLEPQCGSPRCNSSSPSASPPAQSPEDSSLIDLRTHRRNDCPHVSIRCGTRLQVNVQANRQVGGAMAATHDPFFSRPPAGAHAGRGPPFLSAHALPDPNALTARPQRGPSASCNLPTVVNANPLSTQVWRPRALQDPWGQEALVEAAISELVVAWVLP